MMIASRPRKAAAAEQADAEAAVPDADLELALGELDLLGDERRDVALRVHDELAEGRIALVGACRLIGSFAMRSGPSVYAGELTAATLPTAPSCPGVRLDWGAGEPGSLVGPRRCCRGRCCTPTTPKECATPWPHPRTTPTARVPTTTSGRPARSTSPATVRWRGSSRGRCASSSASRRPARCCCCSPRPPRWCGPTARGRRRTTRSGTPTSSSTSARCTSTSRCSTGSTTP